MPRRPDRTPPDDATDPMPGGRSVRAGGPEWSGPDVPDLSSLSIAGLTRRRFAAILGSLIAVWIVVVFARQVGDASAASTHAAQMAIDNAVLTTQVAAYHKELEQIQGPHYVELEARAYKLGDSREQAFTLSADAPSLADDAPGSASVRLGSQEAHVTPLEHWLTLLFGPGG